jgi:hypothetical protein
MVHKSSIIPGLSRFIDESILVHYPPTSMKRILIASGISLYLSGNEQVVDTLLANPIISTLGVSNSNGMIDIDKVRNAVRPEVEKAGFMRITVPVMGDIDLTVDDIDTLYRYITEVSNSSVTTSLPPRISNGGVY